MSNDLAAAVGGSYRRPDGFSLGPIVYSADDIARRTAELAAEIEGHYPPGDDVLLLGVLTGAYVFTADLARRMDRAVRVDFMAAYSYGDRTQTSGAVNILYDPPTPLEGRHVIVVEDIVDSGTTLAALGNHLRAKNPASVEACALLRKAHAPTSGWQPRWVGFDCPNDFLVGYGLDIAGKFRHLPHVAALKRSPTGDGQPGGTA